MFSSMVTSTPYAVGPGRCQLNIEWRDLAGVII
jgi:hypothetical protein